MISAENHHFSSFDFTSLSTAGHIFTHVHDPKPFGDIFYEGARNCLETKNLFRAYPEMNGSVNLVLNRNCMLHNVVDVPRTKYLCSPETMNNVPDTSFCRHEIPTQTAKRINKTEESDHLNEPPMLNTNDCVLVISKTHTPQIDDFDREKLILNYDNCNLKTDTNAFHSYNVKRKKVYLGNKNMQNYDAHGNRNFACQQCNYKTDRKNNLKRHIATMHSDCNRNLECCDLIFKCKATLREHVRSLHNTGYRCKVCERNFCRKALLRRHLTVHNGKKDFQCTLCDYATSHKSNLERHQKVHDKSFQSEENSSKWKTVRCLLLLQKQKHRVYSRKITGENNIDIARDDMNKDAVPSNETSKNVPKFACKERDKNAVSCSSNMSSIEYKEDNHIEKSEMQVKMLISKLYKNVSQIESYEDNSYIPSHDFNICKTPMNEHGRHISSKNRLTSPARHKRLCLNPYHCAECKSSFSKQRALYYHDCKGYIHLSSYSVVSIFRKWIQCPSHHIISTV
ncbi:hypothetical protein ACJMK2_018038 [Sinanodonta woodiana]|uniref:C2H2-type domain-containing protein n=1 Tax=Sinanodonta woodiana TaxID=1069815 RepID=A0ABD3UF80_SINWO